MHSHNGADSGNDDNGDGIYGDIVHRGKKDGSVGGNNGGHVVHGGGNNGGDDEGDSEIAQGRAGDDTGADAGIIASEGDGTDDC